MIVCMKSIDIAQYKDKLLINILSVFATITFVAGINDWYLGNTFDYIVDFIICASSTISILLFKKYNNTILVSSILFWMVALAAYAFNFEYKFDSNVIYLILTPIIALLLLPKKYILIYIFLYELGVLILLLYGYHLYPEQTYIFSINGIVSYIFASIFLFATWWFYNNTIQKTLEALKKSNQEKSALLQELHHRVKNNFNLIVSMLDIQHSNSSTIDTHTFVRNFKDRIQSIVIAHELLYMDSDLDSINMQNYINDLAHYILDANSDNAKIKLECNIDSFYLNIDTLIYIGILINEMLTNSIKHAFKNKKGTIYISLKKQKNNTYILSYKDSATHVNKDTKSGFGSMVIDMAVSQIEGHYTKEINNSIEYKIYFEAK